MVHGRVSLAGALVSSLLAIAAFTPAAMASSDTATATIAKVTTTTATTTTSTTSTSTTPPKPAPAAKGSMKLYLDHAFYLGGNAVTVPNRWVHVGGVVTPYVPGQWVNVKVYLGSRVIKTDRLRVKRSRSGWYGKFTEGLWAPSSGLVTVEIQHARNSKMLFFQAHRRFAALDANAGNGEFVQLIQQRLAALHIYIPQTGVFDQGTQLALNAYHRLLGWGEGNTNLDAGTITRLLDGVGAFHVRFPSHGSHAEGNLSLQVLALINGSKVREIYPISSGKPSTPTILGDFQVYYRVPGYLPDGMYYSSFFIGGYAIHGYNPAPDYPASHGCMRVPIVDAISIFNWLTYGDWVDTYY